MDSQIKEEIDAKWKKDWDERFRRLERVLRQEAKEGKFIFEHELMYLEEAKKRWIGTDAQKMYTEAMYLAMLKDINKDLKDKYAAPLPSRS